MLILMLSFYDSNPSTVCYTQHTQLTIYDKKLVVVLQPQNTKCDFPSGVMAQLQFTNETLNRGQIFISFNYLQTKELVFSCENCELYDNIQQASLLIDSAQMSTFFSIGSVLNMRKDAAEIIKTSAEKVKNGICMTVKDGGIGYKMTQKEISMVVSIYHSQDICLTVSYESLSKVESIYCFEGEFQVEYFEKVAIFIRGVIDGVIVSNKYTTQLITIYRQPEIFYGISSTIYSNFLYIGFKRINPEFNDFIRNQNIDQVKFVIKYIFKSDIQFITGKLDPILLKNSGNIICDVTDDPELCKDIMRKVLVQPISQRRCSVFLNFDSLIVRQEITEWSSTCFEDAKIVVFKNKITINLIYDLSSITSCALIESQQIFIKIGFFPDIQHFTESESGFNIVEQFKYNWTGRQQKFHLYMRNQKHFFSLKNYQYTGFYIFDNDDTFVDLIQAKIEINLAERIIFYVFLSIVISLLIIFVVFILSVKQKRTSFKKIKVKIDEI